MEMFKKKEITEEQLQMALHTQSNVAESTIMLIQTHKPGRYSVQELKDTIKKTNERKKELIRKQLEK
jgi:hypothetical protein